MPDQAQDHLPVVFLMGPTAAGKTSLAARLRDALSCELISVDSAMVYRGMDIGTAKPTRAQREQTPYRLMDVCEPTEHYSASRFCQDALRAIEEIFSQGRIPLLVGGTGLYFRSLEQGLTPLPGADPTLRDELERRAREQGWPALHAELADVDPESAARIHAHDAQRIQRALEVWHATGAPWSELLRRRPRQSLPWPVVKMALAPEDRGQLHEKIADRFDKMLEQGLLREVESLFRREGMHAGLPAMRLVGYRQVWRHLEGKTDHDTMRAQAIAATRQLAKRQYTWLRKETQTRRWHGTEPPEHIINEMIQHVSEQCRI